MNQEIEKFNKMLIEENYDLTIQQYVDDLNDTFFHIDPNIITEFMRLIDTEEFIIHHNMLDKYGILKTDNRNSGHIKRLLEQYEFEDEKDYIIKESESGYSLDYFLKPEVFKMLLMRSKNTRKYAEYYILLEKAVYWYDKYQLQKLKKLRLLTLNNSDTLDHFVIVKCDEDAVHIKRVKDKTYILKHNYKRYPYAIIKGEAKNINRVMKRNRLKFENITLMMKVPCHWNFTKKMREVLGDDYDIQYVYTNRKTKEFYLDVDESDFDEEAEYDYAATKFFAIKNMTEEEFIEKVKQIDLSRLN